MSNVSFVLDAEARNDMGKGASRRLRNANKVPAIMYGGGKEPVAITLEHHKLTHALANEAFYSHILTINFAGKPEKAVLKDVHRHPWKPIILHIDLQRVDENQKLHMHVPLHFINEDIAPGVKIGGGLISHLQSSVEVACLPKDLPEFIRVDLGTLERGHTLHLSDLELPAGVELLSLAHGSDLPVVTITAPRVEEEAAPAAAAAAPAAEGEKKEG